MKTADRILSSVLDNGRSLMPEYSSKPAAGRCPTIFVHGFLGWGERDELNRLVPYWGLAGGNILSFLNSRGYECHAASVGCLSSAWDRACELYAQLMGGRVDYGAAHSKKYGHTRYGITYDHPLVSDWSEEKKLDFVAHSFGGATVRLFLDILENGREAELSSCCDPSPFFVGGKGGYVRSVTTLAAPHNGTTLVYSNENLAVAITALFSAASRLLGISDYKGVYDFQLDQFGIKRVPGETISDSVKRMLGADFLSTGDHALHDLSVDCSLQMNSSIKMLPGVYYFSYPACRTHQSLISYDQIPDTGMTPLLAYYSTGMGRYLDSTPDGRKIGRGWLPNDGLVNTVSATYPLGEPFKMHLKSDDTFSPGVWNVMPVRHLDHLAMIGGVFNMDTQDTKKLYMDIMQTIDRTYK